MKGSILRDRQQQKILRGIMANEICILGAGGHAKVVIEIAELVGYKILEIFDQNEAVTEVLQYQVNHNFENLSQCKNVFLALGNNQSRKTNAGSFSTSQFNLIHPSVIISKNAKIGSGNVMMAGVIINSSANIGNHCIINTGACIDHDCVIGDFVHISPRVALAGNVTVEEGAQVGIGACVKQNIKIGKWAIVGAGAVVVNDVPDFSVVVGNPARVIKKRKDL